VDQAVDAAVGQRQEDMERAARLLAQRSPNPELEHLPGSARLVARPWPGHDAELIAG
jgi:hypothetical protein